MHFRIKNMPQPTPQCPDDGYLCLKEYYPKNAWGRVTLDKNWEGMVDKVAGRRKGEASPGYKVGVCLGKGGFGVVYTVMGDRKLVVKRMKNKLGRPSKRPPTHDPYPYLQLRDFAGVVATLELAYSPNYATEGRAHVHASVRNLYVSDGYLHVVSRRCEGDLREKVFEWRTMTEHEKMRHAFTAVRGILHGVAFMHKNGFVHRDIKLDNVLMCEGAAKLADFDLTTRWTPGDPKLHGRGGTPGYMSPQMEGDLPYDGRKHDMYAVGKIIGNVLPFIKVADTTGLEDLRDKMLKDNEDLRPSAEEALGIVEKHMDTLALA